MVVTVYTYLVTPLVINSINTIHLNLIKVRHYNIKFQYLPEFTRSNPFDYLFLFTLFMHNISYFLYAFISKF